MTTRHDGPFYVERRLAWGDCDPAGFIYTPRVLDQAYQALGEWYRDWLGQSWWDTLRETGLGSPTVHAECMYLSPVLPDQRLRLEVRVIEIGNSSLIFRIDGIGEEGASFTVIITSCLMRMDSRTPERIPERTRSVIEAYIAAHPATRPTPRTPADTPRDKGLPREHPCGSYGIESA